MLGMERRIHGVSIEDSIGATEKKVEERNSGRRAPQRREGCMTQLDRGPEWSKGNGQPASLVTVGDRILQ